MVQSNEDVMSRPSDSRPSTSGSGPFLANRWPGGARPKIFNHRSYSSGSRPSVLSRASGSIRSGVSNKPGSRQVSRSNSRFGSRGSLVSGSICTVDDLGSATSRLKREVPSFSDICGYDEVQELLRDIEALECRPWTSDWESFTIQSSHPDLDMQHDIELLSRDFETLSRSDSRLSWDSHAGRQPEDDDSDPCASPGGEFSSRNFPRPVPTITIAWDDSHLKTSVGIFRLLLVVLSVVTMTCACTVGTSRLSLFVLPGGWRVRVMLFTSVFTILTTTVLLLLHVSSIVYSMAIRWDRLVTGVYAFCCLSFLCSSSLLLHLLHLYHTSYQWIPAWTKQQLLTTSLCGCASGVVSLVLAVISGYGWPRYGRVLSESSTVDTSSSHHMHTFHQVVGGRMVGESRGGVGSSGSSLLRGHSSSSGLQHQTTTFTPDSLEPLPGPSKSNLANHTPGGLPHRSYPPV
ncbi:uncharacterized protein LOC108672052 isoform X2 [Hyalella azteca]|uniref:Uncharacterized protein LOC108672052 isoform X1 n=1 Tax=Hyalella azteca TaxID=294128 RepID=A0A8B7NN90_HYAAZ|nr:uncharacterized protein LOC108672052 isoform X1 [Hyalella azteca]XP_047737048.1 uncharacterized protein LOC108672052 isoform X2 [Hyalella azteca]